MKQYALCGGEALARAVEQAYGRGETDYSLEPLNLETDDGAPAGVVRPGDAVIFCCRRGEREVELTDAFTDAHFTGFDREQISPLDFVILTMYHENTPTCPSRSRRPRCRARWRRRLSEAGKTQLHCAESEKFAHVTFFFNGGNQHPFPGEDDVRIPSPKGVPFDTVPGLRLPGVVNAVTDGLKHGYDFIVANFANGDVIGHTSNDEAKIACAGIVDTQLGRTLEAARAANYTVLVCADHGNLEVMHTAEGKPHVAHTSNLIAFAAVAPDAQPVASEGRLCDVAPHGARRHGRRRAAEMTGKPVFRFPDGPRKVLLLILDGWGLGEQNEHNPLHIADTPVWDALLASTPWVPLAASGEAVGLAAGKAGNSEAGHINLGSGRVVLQDDVRLDKRHEGRLLRRQPGVPQGHRHGQGARRGAAPARAADQEILPRVDRLSAGAAGYGQGARHGGRVRPHHLRRPLHRARQRARAAGASWAPPWSKRASAASSPASGAASRSTATRTGARCSAPTSPSPTARASATARSAPLRPSAGQGRPLF